MSEEKNDSTRYNLFMPDELTNDLENIKLDYGFSTKAPFIRYILMNFVKASKGQKVDLSDRNE